MLTLTSPHNPDSSVRVFFKKSAPQSSLETHQTRGEGTYALVAIGPKDGRREDYTIVGEGSAFRHRLDTPNPNKARKVALARALSAAGFDKELRTVIWNAYGAARGKDSVNGEPKFD